MNRYESCQKELEYELEENPKIEFIKIKNQHISRIFDDIFTQQRFWPKWTSKIFAVMVLMDRTLVNRVQ